MFYQGVGASRERERSDNAELVKEQWTHAVPVPGLRRPQGSAEMFPATLHEGRLWRGRAVEVVQFPLWYCASRHSPRWVTTSCASLSYYILALSLPISKSAFSRFLKSRGKPFPCRYTRNITWIGMTAEYNANSHCITHTFIFKRLGECTFWTWEWKG